MLAERVDDVVLDDIFLRVHGVGHLTRLHLKIEGLNPAGSIKLKAARSLVQDAERRLGPLHSRHLVESTSGNLGIALASICAARGYRLTCVTDPNANAASIAVMRSLGADVVVVRERDANGGYLASRIAHVRSLLADERYVWLNQYDNPANPRAHEQWTAQAVLRQFGSVDHLVVGVGTGGTFMGCVRAMRALSPRTRIVAVDSLGSVTFGGPAGPRRIPGLGASRPSTLVDADEADVVVHVPEHETVRECRWLARTTGLLGGGSTGTVLAAVRALAPGIDPGDTVVAISPDLGERYVATVYSDEWVAAHHLDAPEPGARTTVAHRKEELVDAVL